LAWALTTRSAFELSVAVGRSAIGWDVRLSAKPTRKLTAYARQF
jgi:hypothetical protein